jgi:5-methylcytosine-specific restriction endonuclease McrA
VPFKSKYGRCKKIMELVEPHSTILVLNSSYEPLHFTNWKRAIVLLFKEKAKLITKRVIRLVSYVRIPFNQGKSSYPSRSLIYKRDDYECQYCRSEKNLTIDHVIPRSRGGQDTWENLVACCSKCNLKKGNLLLSETSMTLKKKPEAPFNRVYLDLQKSRISEWKDYVIG